METDRLICVIGDVMLDQSIFGDSSRVAPEGPVPVVLQREIIHTPGGAGNVAANISTLGGHCRLHGACGADHFQNQLYSCLGDYENLEAKLCGGLTPCTTVKTRVYAAGHLVARYDRESVQCVSSTFADRVVASLQAHKPAVVVLADYAKGALHTSNLDALITAAKQLQAQVLVDPKGTHWGKYAGADLIKPNLTEAWQIAYGHSPPNDVTLKQVTDCGRSLAKRFLVKVLVTCGPLGLVLCEPSGATHHQPAYHPQRVYDLQGAGDTVMAALAVELANGADIKDALRFAAVAAGLVISKPGTATVTREEVLNYDNHLPRKNISLPELQEWAEACRARGESIAFANGCFDLLHPAHIALLQFARRQAGHLVVAIDDDDAIRAQKGPDRPLVSYVGRASMLAALECVDAVLLFGNSDPLPVIQACRPDVLVKGGSYYGTAIPGEPEVLSWGGRVVLFPMVGGYSTTKLVEKIQQCGKGEEVKSVVV